MKKLLTIATLLMVFVAKSFSQDCSTVTTTTDKMTNETTTQADPIIVQGVNFHFFILKEGSICCLATVPSACAEAGKVSILLSDGTKLSITNFDDFNCKGEIMFEVKGKSLEALKTKTISTIRLDLYDYKYVQMDLTDDEKNIFKQDMNCLSTFVK